MGKVEDYIEKNCPKVGNSYCEIFEEDMENIIRLAKEDALEDHVCGSDDYSDDGHFELPTYFEIPTSL